MGPQKRRTRKRGKPSGQLTLFSCNSLGPRRSVGPRAWWAQCRPRRRAARAPGPKCGGKYAHGCGSFWELKGNRFLVGVGKPKGRCFPKRETLVGVQGVEGKPFSRCSRCIFGGVPDKTHPTGPKVVQFDPPSLTDLVQPKVLWLWYALTLGPAREPLDFGDMRAHKSPPAKGKPRQTTRAFGEAVARCVQNPKCLPLEVKQKRPTFTCQGSVYLHASGVCLPTACRRPGISEVVRAFLFFLFLLARALGHLLHVRPKEIRHNRTMQMRDKQSGWRDCPPPVETPPRTFPICLPKDSDSTPLKVVQAQLTAPCHLRKRRKSAVCLPKRFGICLCALTCRQLRIILFPTPLAATANRS